MTTKRANIFLERKSPTMVRGVRVKIVDGPFEGETGVIDSVFESGDDTTYFVRLDSSKVIEGFSLYEIRRI